MDLPDLYESITREQITSCFFENVSKKLTSSYMLDKLYKVAGTGKNEYDSINRRTARNCQLWCINNRAQLSNGFIGPNGYYSS